MKLRKSVMAFIVISLIATFLSCEPGWSLLINDSEKVTMDFNNSKVEIFASTMGGVIHWLIIDYYLESDIIIHPGAINVGYENDDIGYRFSTKDGKEINEQNYKLEGSGSLYLSFKIYESELGDTIKITAPDFITYNGKTISLGELILVVGNKVEKKD
jgi:hypothetical protein